MKIDLNEMNKATIIQALNDQIEKFELYLETDPESESDAALLAEYQETLRVVNALK